MQSLKHYGRRRTIVAFSAYRSTAQKLTSSNEPFKFDNVWTNIGNAYDPSTGIFTAPHKVVYHFPSVALSISGENLNLKLVHNKRPTAQNWVTGGGYKTGTIDVVFDIQKGDKLHVGAASVMALFRNSNKYGIFSGYLVI